jgi:hypothetical protein
MAEPSISTIRLGLAVLGRLGRNRLRAYRRIRWKRHPGWVARTQRKPPSPDIILVAMGSRAASLALWEVQGPKTDYLLDWGAPRLRLSQRTSPRRAS